DGKGTGRLGTNPEGAGKMNQLVVSLAWCWIQALVIAALALLLSAITVRRSPAAGAAIAAVGIVATLVLALLMPVPIPRWGLTLQSMERGLFSQPPDARMSNFNGPSQPTAQGEADEQSAGAGLNLDFLRGIATSIQRSQAAAGTRPRTTFVAIGILAGGMILA